MRRRRGWLAVLALVLVVCACVVASVLVRWRSVPRMNTAQKKFDVILVLGVPCNKDGSPSWGQVARTRAGVQQWRDGVAPRLILSGGAAHNSFVEADCMARVAEAAGVPDSAILREGQSQDTIQNIYYSNQILQAHGWHSVDVVSFWNHLPRAALILAHYPLLWRTDVAPFPHWYDYPLAWPRDWGEALYTLRLKRFGFRPSHFIARWP